MNIANLWAEIEKEHKWRWDEIRFFQNQISSVSPPKKRDIYRKALILVLYSHFEGFCKFAFSHYVNAINAENLDCGQVSFALTASSLSDVFKELRNPGKKNPDFGRELPDDAKLHSFARDKEFLENTSGFSKRSLTISPEAVDMESNLKPVVLRKNLYKLGFLHDKFSSIEGQIDKLLNFRNSIAHGAHVAGITEEDYESLRDDVDRIIKELKTTIMKALQNGDYLRT